jgi:hypothetical protein
MKTVFNISALAVFLFVTPGVCFALTLHENISPKRAKALGMEVRSKAAGPKHVRVQLEFKPEGELKDFTQVELRFGPGNDPALTKALRADRSKPGRVAVSFTADSAQLDKLTLEVMVPASDGRKIYVLRVKDFVEVKKDR